ncbi:MAG: Serine--tRNA ligase [Candidatus Omnitrophica bacterium ADurb.Bin292]|nr:MAG: Serine--tRNA ligase [Candidatus Omnitrophica bacterium ADurb.Bin292]
MLDLKFIRENPEAVKKGLSSKGVEFDLGGFLSMDAKRRTLLRECEDLKAKRNEANNKIASLKKEGKDTKELIAEMRAVSQKIDNLDLEVGGIDEKIESLCLSIPNIPLLDVPVSKGAEGNKIIRTWGEPRKLAFKGKDHQHQLRDARERVDPFLLPRPHLRADVINHGNVQLVRLFGQPPLSTGPP